jgi:segregation and condensation protein B
VDGLKAILEALLFATDEPLAPKRLSALLEEASPSEIRAALEELRADCEREGRGLRLAEIAGGFRLLTRPELDPWVARLRARAGRARLSQAALETLAIVAYRQPVTRIDLEEIRGVNVEAVLRTLIERDLVTIVGRDEGLGRPLLYGTTDAFLAYFGLSSLRDLPRRDELEVFLASREPEAAAEPPPEASAPADAGHDAAGHDAADAPDDAPDDGGGRDDAADAPDDAAGPRAG